MNAAIKTRLYLGFTVAILLVISVGVISYQTFKQQNYEAGMVKHTYKVLNQLESTEKLLVDMETGRRGFRSTNEKRFLQPYYSGLSQIEPAIRELHSLTSDNPVQTANLNRLHLFINDLLSYWSSIGEDASKNTREIIISINEKEKIKMDAVRSLIQQMGNVENELLVKRENANAYSMRLATWELIIGIALILLTVLILIRIILSEFKTRTKAEEQLVTSNKELEEVNIESNERNWQLTGVAEVNNNMQGSENLPVLTSAVLNTIVRYLQIEAGAFYTYKEDKKELILSASNGLPNNAKTSYGLGEGLVGSAATKESLSIVKDIPTDYLQLAGGLIKGTAAEVVYIPIYLHKELKAVLELLTMKTFTKQHIVLLKVISDNLAVALDSADKREQVMHLLKQVQEQKDILENQQEELRQAYEDLSLQTETLQASEEELKVQEEELRQINAELEERNESVETARQALLLKAKELEVTSKYKSEFLANMSHELRTPLNSVLILAKLLAENKAGNLTEKQMDQAKIIYKSGSDLLELINDILDISKIEAGKVDLDIEQVPISSIASDIEQLFRVVAEEKEIDFKVRIDPDVPPFISTDKQRVEQILKNLLSNSFKFTSTKGFINLSFSCVKKGNDSVLKIAVSDTGIGISKEKQKVIFEAFQQADMSTSRKFGGTGLGLSITKELLRMLGGTIELDSKEGKGSTFTISLLFEKNDLLQKQKGVLINKDPEEDVEEQSIIKDDRVSLVPSDKVLLIIEDDVDFASIVKNISQKNGYKAIVALRGDEGLKYARKYKPDAIILDMNLPGMDGGMVLKKIKGIDELKNTPVHIISATEENKFVIPGAFAYLKKPVQKKDLENVFASLDQSYDNSIKKVLLITGESLNDNKLQQLLGERHFNVKAENVTTFEEAVARVEKKKYDCVIADIGSEVERGIDHLQLLSTHLASRDIPVIVYLNKDITIDNELKLKKVSDVVVRNSTSSTERLMDELELFLYKVSEDSYKREQLYLRSTAATSDKTLEGKKVLLVDDDMRNIFALSSILEDEKMKVITAGDGKEALQSLKSEPDVDIVLMDIMMPEMDGFEAMKHIRNDMHLKKLPIIALTAKAMAGDREKCFEAGASDYITKPVDIQKLQSLMRVWLSN